MKRAIALLIACLALGLVAAGCGGGDDDSDSGSADTQDQSTPAPSAEEPAEDNSGAGSGGTSGGGGGKQVAMKDIKFSPGTVTIKARGKVTWNNHDSVGHDVTTDDFDSGGPGGIEPGNSFTHTFKKPGTYGYVCSVHPGMEGTVKVKK